MVVVVMTLQFTVTNSAAAADIGKESTIIDNNNKDEFGGIIIDVNEYPNENYYYDNYDNGGGAETGEDRNISKDKIKIDQPAVLSSGGGGGGEAGMVRPSDTLVADEDEDDNVEKSKQKEAEASFSPNEFDGDDVESNSDRNNNDENLMKIDTPPLSPDEPKLNNNGNSLQIILYIIYFLWKNSIFSVNF